MSQTRTSGSSPFTPTITYSVPGNDGCEVPGSVERLMSVCEGTGSERVCEW